VAVEQYALPLGPHPSKEWHARRQLVNDKCIRSELSEFACKDRDGKDEMQLPQDRKKDMEAVQEGWWEYGIASYSNIERACESRSCVNHLASEESH
jgi:hypothetical protein